MGPPSGPSIPDANLTLRVAYGPVAGYEYADGEYHKPQTTLDGIIAKDNPEIYDYDIPQRCATSTPRRSTDAGAR